MNMNVHIRETDGSDIEHVLGIARALRSWFTEKGERFIQQDAEFQNVLIAEVDSKPVGFLTYFTYEGVGHIGWMGVLPDEQRQGIGTALFRAFESAMKERNIDLLQVHTLGDGVEYHPYNRTRDFYRKMGFETYRVEKTDNPECPEDLTLRKRI